MIDMIESQKLMEKFIELKKKVKETGNIKDVNELKKHEVICLEKFKYLITMRTNRYKLFDNYDDLNQEGNEVLIKAMNNYNPKKGNFFFWAHRYVQTRISRSANAHTVIRYPLKIAKNTVPHRESSLPTLIEEINCPDKQLEKCQTSLLISDAMSILDDEQRNVITLAYGFNGDKPMSRAKICRQLNISRSHCAKVINTSLDLLKTNIKL